MYLKRRDSILVINNDEEALLTNISARAKAKELQKLKKEVDLLRKELDKVKVIVVELMDGRITNPN